MAAILNAKIYERSRSRLLWYPKESEIVLPKLHMGQIWHFM